ncbi:MAG TPA: hypothetical protein VEW66_07025 [Thermomicrobiales bacterium]|nr:hypothetical protein [Thermomicrobiales bacterium]
MGSFRQRLIDPFVIPIVITIITVIGIVMIGEMLLGLFTAGDTKDRLDRPELWGAVGLAVVIIGGAGFLATRPTGTTGPLEKEVVIGSQPFFQPALPPVTQRARVGETGTVSDVGPGYTLYAQSGALAEVIGVLPGATDFGKQFAGFFYAKGLSGASSELWIPFEAVLSVYPESQSAFLAIKGDETEHFGWNVPPESVRRGPVRGGHEL